MGQDGITSHLVLLEMAEPIGCFETEVNLVFSLFLNLIVMRKVHFLDETFGSIFFQH